MAYCSVIGSPDSFAHCLAGFQVQELLTLQKSVEAMEESEPTEATTNCPDLVTEARTDMLPERLALMASAHDGSDPGGPYPHSQPPTPTWPAEAKPSKLQTLFQISITALAFLSFGGYLLCLIVQAIKSKGTTYFHPVATATTTNSNGNVKRIKIYRRSRRQAESLAHFLRQDYASYMQAMRDRAHLVGS